MGGTMVPLTPFDQYSNHLLATSPWGDSNSRGMMTIVASGYPVSGMLFNGDSIDNLDWTSSVGGDYATVMMDISCCDVMYEVVSTNENITFAAYFYTTNYQLNFNHNVFAKSSSIGQEGAFSSEGSRFIYTYPPSHHNNFIPYVQITAREATEVVVATLGGSDIYFLQDNDFVIHYGVRDDRVTSGVEEKGWEVSSTKPVSVQMGSANFHRDCLPEDSLLRPIHAEATEFFVLSLLDDVDRHALTSEGPFSYFSIVAYLDDTVVDVYDTNNQLYTSATLQRLESLTVDASTEVNGEDIDFSGYHIVASKGVSVNAGHGHVYHGAKEQFGAITESLPAVSEQGSEYITHPVALGYVGQGYTVRVMAATTQTRVQIPEHDVDYYLNQGQFYEVNHTNSDSIFKITCSSNCSVAEYIKRSSNEDNMLFRSNPAMTMLTPVEYFSGDILFTTPWMDENTVTILAIVVNADPVNNIYLNDQHIVSSMWTAGADGFSHTTLNVKQDTLYHLRSEDSGERFSGYVYSSSHDIRSSRLVSKAASLGYGVIEDITNLAVGGK